MHGRQGRASEEAYSEKRALGPGAVVVVSALVLVAAALIPAFPGLEVRDWRSGRLLYLAPVRLGEEFEVSFVHSVEKTPVREVFEAGRDLSIYLVETIYKSFGAGLPTAPDDGARLVLERGKIRITGMHRRIGELLLSISPVPGHILMVGRDTVVLADLAEPGTGLSIKVVREPAVIRFLGGRYKWTTK